MTREEVKELFPDATDEQITSLLNKSNAEVAKERGKGEKYKADAQKVLELQKQLDEASTANMTEMEKAVKELEKANARIAELERSKVIDDDRSLAVAKWGITPEQAKEVIGDDGKMNIEALGKIISEKTEAAAVAKEQEIANNATNPGGGTLNDGKPEEEKPKDVANAENITFGGLPENAQSARDYYK